MPDTSTIRAEPSAPTSDIAICEPGRFKFDAAMSLSAVKWSSFDGREMRIRVTSTYLRGQKIFEDGKLLNTAGDGRFLRPQDQTADPMRTA